MRNIVPFLAFAAYGLISAWLGWSARWSGSDVVELRDQIRDLQFQLTQTESSCRVDFQALERDLAASLDGRHALEAELDVCYNAAARLPAVAIADAGTALRLADGYLFTVVQLLEPRAADDGILNSALVYLGEARFHLSDVNSWLGLPPLPTPVP